MNGVKCYLVRRNTYTFNKPTYNVCLSSNNNELDDFDIAQHFENLIQKSMDFNFDETVDEGTIKNIYPPPNKDYKELTGDPEFSEANKVEGLTEIKKGTEIKQNNAPETFLPSIVQLPDYDDTDWCPDFYIGDFKSPGIKFVEKNNDHILEWANKRRASRGLPPIKVRWKKLSDSPYLNEKALNIDTNAETIISETRPTNGKYTCGAIWKIPEMQEEYELMREQISKNNINTNYSHYPPEKINENELSDSSQGGIDADNPPPPTWYDKLPRDEDGIAIFEKIQDIERLSIHEIKRELIARGYRTGGSLNEVRQRLLDSFNDPTREWRIKNIVKKKLECDNSELSEEVRNKLKDIEDKERLVESMNEVDDLKEFVDKLSAFAEINRYYEDPVGYLDLDSGIDLAGLTEEEIEELKNAPKVEDFGFYKKLNAPEVDFVDRLEKTFNLEENRPKIPPPRYEDESTIYEMKKKFLEIEEGFHEHNVGMIVERFGVSEAFVVDVLCKLGADPPIDPTEPIKRYIDYNAIWNFLEYLNIVDPIDTQVFYSTETLEEIAHDYNVKLGDLIEAGRKIKIKLPYGEYTKPNMQCKSAMLHYLYKQGKLVDDNYTNPYLERGLFPIRRSTSNDIAEIKVEEEVIPPIDDD